LGSITLLRAFNEERPQNNKMQLTRHDQIER
jgi:hypothetical protein